MTTPVSRKECRLVYLLCVFLVFVKMRYGFVACSESMHLRSEYDLNIYYLIGNGWMHGMIPYVSMADLKGPLVFLLHGICSIMTPGSFLGLCVVNALVVGVGLLFAYKTARLFLSTAGSAAVIGLYLYLLFYFAGHPAEQVWTLQHVTMYLVLRWSVGRVSCFGRGELVFLGACVAAVLLLKFNLLAFWGPICLLAICLNGWRAVLYQGVGFAALMLPCLVYFWWHDALLSLWHEYVATAVAYGHTPWADSALATKHLTLFRGTMPYHLYMRVPSWLLAIPGCVPCIIWPLLWFRKDLPLRRAAFWVLLCSFVVSAYASYSGKYDFLHYAFVFFPFCLLSLVYGVCLLQPYAGRVLNVLGAVAAASVILVSTGLPVYVKHGRQYNGNAQMKETAQRMSDWMKSVPHDDIFILDGEKSLHLYRLTGRLPRIKHFVPPLIHGGERLYRQEQVDYIKQFKPKYLIGSDWRKEKEVALIRQSGVTYTVVTHRQLGLPPYPPHAKQPEIILYTRVDK